ncbi:MAG: hypothetical protein H0U13_15805 [Gemmatimonadaceae bacterium]|nr:hypothetical protein [Gemmatimonadaceae bacterium]
MARRNLARLFLVVVFAAGSAGCSDRSPLAPTVQPDIPQTMGRLVSVSGVYELTFLHRGQPVTSLPVGQEVVLKAHVEDAAGSPAQRGSVTFQYCSRKGPSNDISRADEAPKSECESGAASWARLQTITVNTSGDAFAGFCCPSIPRTVGFRFKYSSQRSGIADGVSAPKDFTWVPAS